MSSTHRQIVIVGGGITGLATAWWLHQSGREVEVLEADSAVGGTMKTIRDGDWLIETGPNSALETTPLFGRIADETGISSMMVYGNEAANKRYILRGGSLHPIPMSPGAFLRSSLWTTSGKLRLLKEPFVGRALHEESVADFVVRRLGREFLDYAVNPFVAGVYAGDPGQLSVRAALPKLYALEQQYGGLIKGQIKGRKERRARAEKSKDRARLFSFREGMQTLPDAIAARLGKRVQTGVRIDSCTPLTEANHGTRGRFLLRGVARTGPVEITAETVIMAIPAYLQAGMVDQLDKSLSQSLKSIYYPPVSEIFLGYRSSDIGRPLDGFGFLVPELERRSILGTIWSSSLFSGRAPDGHVALTTFVGGARQPDIALQSGDQLLALVQDELRRLMGIDGKPVKEHVVRWEKAIPQYRLGHLQIVEDIERFEARHPGLFLAGNFRGGISVGDCMMSSERLAQAASQQTEVNSAGVAITESARRIA